MIQSYHLKHPDVEPRRHVVVIHGEHHDRAIVAANHTIGNVIAPLSIIVDFQMARETSIGTPVVAGDGRIADVLGGVSRDEMSPGISVT